MAPDPLSNQEEDWLWLKSSQEGDRSAFERIFNKHKRLVVNLAFRFLRNKEAAEDIAQEVFLKLYEKKFRLRPESKFSTWLYRVTVNASLDSLRKKKPARFSPEGPGPGAGYESTSLESLAAPAPSLLHNLQDEELKETVRAEIGKLPEKLKTVLLLFQFEDLSYREIAGILGITEKAVEKRIYHGREQLRKKLRKIHKSL